MKNVLILCTGNSCRSQIAHGFLAKYAADKAQIYSAGVETHGVNSKAIETMNKVSIDLTDHTSNNVNEYFDVDFDFVITVCDNAKERCPYFPTNAIKLHRNFPDPAKATGSEEEINTAFDQVRDMIDDYCKDFVKNNLN